MKASEKGKAPVRCGKLPISWLYSDTTIWGENDVVFPGWHAQLIAGLCSEAAVITIPHYGHWSPLDARRKWCIMCGSCVAKRDSRSNNGMLAPREARNLGRRRNPMKWVVVAQEVRTSRCKSSLTNVEPTGQ